MSHGPLGYNLGVERERTGGVKPLVFFFCLFNSQGVAAADGWLDCESAEIRSGLKSWETRWCVICIYLTDAPLLPHSPTGRCTV